MSAVLQAQEPSARYVDAVAPQLVRDFQVLAEAPGSVARLRQLILSMAVRGKLVPQQSPDEPASGLIGRLVAARAKRLGAGPSASALDTAVRDDGAFPCELPSGWAWVRLTDLGAFCGGKTPSKQIARYWSGSIPWITPKDMKRLRLADSEDHVSQAAVDDGLELIPRNSLLIVVRSGILRRTVPSAVNEVETTINQDLKALKLTAPEMSAYVQLLVRGFEQFILDTLTKVGTTVESIRFDDFATQLFPLPPVAEQARILARVDELMQLCDALEAKGRLEAQQHARLLETLLGTLTDSTTPEELAANWQRVAEHFDLLLDRPEAVDVLEQTVLQLAVRGRLVPQDPSEEPASVQLRHIAEERARLISAGVIKRSKPVLPVAEEEQPFVLPRGWEWARLEQLSLAIVDCPHSTPKFVDSGILCIDTNSFKGGVLLPHKLRYVDQATYQERIDRLAPAPGDLLFAREGSVGESVIIPPGTTACLGQRVMLFRFFHHVSNEFIRLAITTPLFLTGLFDLHKGIGAKHVNVGDMRMAIVPVPPIAEQLRVLKRVAELRQLCADLRQRLAASQATQSRLAEALVESALA